MCLELARLNHSEITSFIDLLSKVTFRSLKSVRILPLHGQPIEWISIEDAIKFIKGYKEEPASPLPVIRYEVQLVYANSNKITGKFAIKNDAIEFLQAYIPVPDGVRE